MSGSIPKDFIRVIVNDFTADKAVHRKMEQLEGIAEFYDNPVVFHTGRARTSEEQNFSNQKIKKTIYEKILPPSFPGRSCFANSSGPLINLAHENVHLCCLPQSPTIGDFEIGSKALVENYLDAVQSYYKTVKKDMKACGLSHACASCEKWSAWDTAKKSNFNIA